MWLLFEFYLSTDIDNIKALCVAGSIPAGSTIMCRYASG